MLWKGKILRKVIEKIDKTVQIPVIGVIPRKMLQNFCLHPYYQIIFKLLREKQQTNEVCCEHALKYGNCKFYPQPKRIPWIMFLFCSNKSHLKLNNVFWWLFGQEEEHWMCCAGFAEFFFFRMTSAHNGFIILRILTPVNKNIKTFCPSFYSLSLIWVSISMFCLLFRVFVRK
jgi:hypothetical protein